MTKVGIYALLRVLVMLLPAERAALSGLIGWIAAATMILGILGALAETDIRRLFGFVIISGVGVMLAGVAFGTPHGLAGTIVYALHSMLSIAALYLLAGAMRDAGGSFSLAALGGLGSARPRLAAAALLLSLAAAGLPPGSGLWPKVMLVNAALQAGAGWLAAAILASGLLTTLAFGRVFLLAFWRDPPAPLPAGAADGRGSSEIALLVLMVPILAIGLYPEPLDQACRHGRRRAGRSGRLHRHRVSGRTALNTTFFNIVLALIWSAVTGSFSLANLLLGLALGGLALFLVRDSLGAGGSFLRTGGRRRCLPCSSKSWCARPGGSRCWCCRRAWWSGPASSPTR